MSKILLLIVLCQFTIVRGQEGIYYYGVNGKLVDQEAEASVMKTVSKGFGKRYKIASRVKMSSGDWKLFSTEDIQIESPETYNIKGSERSFISGKGRRTIEDTGNGTFIIKDFRDGHLLRTAYCSSVLPLHFHGLVTEYYDNGNKKTEAVYEDNQLQSNTNWNPDGSPYINSIFYITHTGPTYPGGNEAIQKHIADQITKNNALHPNLWGYIILGAVVMETGELDGIRIVDRSTPDLIEPFIAAVKSLPETWGPATLHGEDVRYYIQLPFNIENKLVSLMDFEITMDGRMIILD